MKQFQKYRFFFLTLILFCSQFVVGQSKTISIVIDWTYPDSNELEYSDTFLEKIYTHNEAAFFQKDDQVFPWQQIDIQTKINTTTNTIVYKVLQADTIDITSSDSFDFNKLSNTFEIQQFQSRNTFKTYIRPLKIENGKLIRFISGTLTYTEAPFTEKHDETTRFATTSVLTEGKWYKLGVTQKGIYKITHQELQDLGIELSNVNPKHISIFGNGNAMLPEANQAACYDDLIENAIFVSGENDNKFDENDYILFYGEEPVTWNYDVEKQQYIHTTNIYTDTIYYFLRIDNSFQGKRIQNTAYLQEEASVIKTDFNDFVLYKKEESSVAPFGRIWVSDMLTIADISEKEIQLQIPKFVQSHEIKASIEVIGHSSKKLFWSVSANDIKLIDSAAISSSGTHTLGVASARSTSFSSDSENLSFRINLHGSSNARLWLNYIQLNFRRKLQYDNQSLFFRFSPQDLSNKLTQIEINNGHQNMTIWDVSDPQSISSTDFIVTNNKAIFKEHLTNQKEYIAFDNNNLLSIASAKKIENQNLHQLQNAEMIIICSKQWLEQGEDLANLHLQLDNLLSVVVDIDEIHNEFGNGTCDPSGIRNFVRMLYTRSNNLKYLFLFGDASYDFRDKLGYGSNFISTYQSVNSLNEVYSRVTDDYFALMDLDEGNECAGIIDIGVGRIPVTTQQQAIDVVNKIKHYLSQQTIGQWRNNMLVMTDDEDGTIYVDQGEELTTQLKTIAKNLNTNKIYIDAFEQIRVSEGDRYPEANKALMRKFDEGMLVFNYIGHGGVLGITDEKVFTSSDAMTLNNIDKLPFMFSGTCEMTRFDDPSIVSLGEQLILNKNGGIIATYTTARPVQGTTAFSLLKNFYQNLFKSDGEIVSLGEAFLLSKSTGNSAGSIGFLPFPLIGDPALKLAYPQKKITCTYVKTEENNGNPIFDTQTIIGPSGTLFVEGHITDLQGNLDRNFNGYLIPRFFDKESVYHTLGNDPNSQIREFKQFDNVLYEGKISIINGKFKFSFSLPIDINNTVSGSKLSLYAYDTITFEDASGLYTDLFVGGVTEDLVIDTIGPDITLYWNNSNFVSGQIIDTDKGALFVELYDPQGIHFCSNTIGRDITLTHNNQVNSSQILNHLFEPKVDIFGSGTIKIDFDKLEEGEHRLKVKAWDLHNNSSEKEIWFTFEKTRSDVFSRIINYPNPFRTSTTFAFENDDSETIFDVLIDIFDVYGIHIMQLRGKKIPYVENIVTWNGLDFSGKKLNSGTYIYRVIISDKNGIQKVFNQKLIYTH